MSEVLTRYLEKLIHDHRRIDARGVMQVSRMIELTLDEVFIDLTVRMGKAEKFELPREFEPRDDEEHDLRRERYTAPQVETGISSAELWQRHAAWVLLGDPGAGKTTLLKHFALQSARAFLATQQPFALSESKVDSPVHGSTVRPTHDSPRTGDAEAFLPILIPLRFLAAEWAQQSWQAKDAVLNYLENQGLNEIGFEDPTERAALFAEFKNSLANGRALLLFDGLDEQRDANIQRNTVQAIESVLQTYPSNRCLASSRIIGYDAAPLGASFHTATLEPFNDEQMAAFFQQWIYAVEQQEDIDPDENTQKRAKEKADDLIAQIQANAGIRTLAANPLLCTIIGLIRRQGATLPTIRVELYKLCIDTFIFNWELQKRRRADQQSSLDKDQTQAVLEEIALYLHERCVDNRASHDQLAQVIREFLVKDKGLNPSDATHKAEQLLNLIRDVSGLLIDRGNAEYGFFHLTFQEYLTARAITRRRKDIDRYLGQHLFEPRWREVIRLAAAHQGMKDAETGSEFIDAIRRHPHPREAIMHYAFRMAFLCLKETKVELDTSDEMMREWVRIYLAQPELHKLMNRLMAQPGLEIRYRDGAIQPLLDVLKDENGDIRRDAAQALGNFKDPAALNALLDAIKDEDSNVRRGAAQALGNFKDPAALNALLGAIKDEDSFVRRDAAKALGNFKDPAALNALLGAIKDEDSFARMGATQALGNFKDPAALNALLGAIKEEDSFARMGATEALGNFKDPAALNALLGAIKDEYSFVRRDAAKALGNFKDPAALNALLGAIKDEYNDVRWIAAQALGNFKNPAA
ncbi:MAG: HEAT repeat domain-containing protein, partial [Gallionella sp.]|nr:HEAT repeat domain-containing protein [Gallionella sp.]